MLGKFTRICAFSLFLSSGNRITTLRETHCKLLGWHELPIPVPTQGWLIDHLWVIRVYHSRKKNHAVMDLWSTLGPNPPVGFLLELSEKQPCFLVTVKLLEQEGRTGASKMASFEDTGVISLLDFLYREQHIWSASAHLS